MTVRLYFPVLPYGYHCNSARTSEFGRKNFYTSAIILLLQFAFVCYVASMRYPKAHKKLSRQKIVQAAARAFNRCGLDGIGIADIMEEAGLTQGAFSWHFTSKEQLIREALEESFHQSLFEQPEWKDRPLEEIFRGYVSRKVQDGCPATTLTSEIARRSRATRDKFNSHLSTILSGLESRLPAKMNPADRKTAAMAIFAMLVGAVQLSRATKGTKLSEEMTEAALKGAASLMRG